MRRTAVLVVVLVLAALIPLSSATAAHHRPSRITVKPATGTRGTHFVVSFTAPQTTGHVGSSVRRYELSVSGPVRSGCVSGGSLELPATPQGARLHATLRPSRFGASAWCAGIFTGRLGETQGAFCQAGVPCPLYLRYTRIARFTFRVRAGPSTDTTPPTFAGLKSAFACTPGPQTPGETTPFTLTWDAATDNVTPQSQIVYDIYESTTSGGENLSKPSWTTAPGVTSFKTPGLASHGTFYFVVRARDRAGNEDHNTVERHGVDPCV